MTALPLVVEDLPIQHETNKSKGRMNADFRRAGAFVGLLFFAIPVLIANPLEWLSLMDWQALSSLNGFRKPRRLRRGN
jgi:hypothetical protein